MALLEGGGFRQRTFRYFVTHLARLQSGSGVAYGPLSTLGARSIASTVKMRSV